MKKIELKVDGIVCNGCENRIQNSLKMIDGVEEVVANHIDKTVKVTLNDDTLEDTIKETINSLGFEVKE